MTYAEKLVKEYALFMFTKGDPIAVEFILNEMLQKAMQAQREACLQNSIQAQKERFGLEHDDMSDWVKQAILNAEVNP